MKTKTQRPKVYLAHAYSNKDRIREIEKEVLKKYLNTTNPFFDIEHKYIKTNSEQIVLSDIQAILFSDYILVMLNNKQTFGTSMEMVYAKAYNKPIFVICSIKKITDNPWIKYHSTKIFKDVNEFIEFVKMQNKIGGKRK